MARRLRFRPVVALSAADARRSLRRTAAHPGEALRAEPSIFAEGFKTDPYWWDAAPPDDEGDQPPPERVDVAVVGSGYTGLSAALELARGSVDVAVLEAQRFGEGASTRSGGMVSGGVNVGKGGDVERLYGADRAPAMSAEAIGRAA